MVKNLNRAVAVALLGVAFAAPLAGVASAAWPTYRADASRSGYTSEAIADILSLAWVHEASTAPRPAWPRSERLPFDRAFHVVAADGSIYFGSSSDHAVYALDAKTGAIRWRYFTDGPVRFAPALWRDRLLVASDDGHLYALAMKDGAVLWKHRGGPSHVRRLGNEQMISKWPARGGPVVVDDVVYYAAGIWPSDGIYLYALNGATGDVLWKNDDSGSIHMPQPHGGANAESGVAAQGYLLVSGPHEPKPQPRDGASKPQPPSLEDFRPGLVGASLLVPTGRAIPAAFDRKGGKFQYFHLQKFGQRGGAPAMAVGSYFFNSGMGFDVQSGDERLKLKEGLITATPDGLALGTAKQVVGYRWAKVEAPDRRGVPVQSIGLESTWLVREVDASGEIIAAGNRVICGGVNRVAIVDPTQQKVIWSAEVQGTAYGLALCDGHLLVSTDSGKIYSFAPGKPDQAPSIATADANPAPYAENAQLAKAAEEILRRFGQDEGYCLDFACGDGQLAYELARRSKLTIWALDDDAKNVALARERLAAAGLYGTRVTVHHAKLDDTGYPDHFADLVVSRRALEGGDEKLAAAERERLPRPAGGIAIFGKADALAAVERPALPGSGTWTHQYTSAANTLCSIDDHVRGSLGMLWFRDVDIDMPQRHGRGPGPLYDAGRLYSLGLDELVCVNAYNGRVLWKYSLPGILRAYNGDELMGLAGTGSNYCLGDGSVYVRLDDSCLRIDAATGKLQAKFKAPAQPDGKPGVWSYIAYDDGVLLGSLGDREHIVTYRYVNRGGDMSKLLTESKTLFALDGKSGELKWRYDAKDSIRHNAIAAGKGAVYLIDRPQATFDRAKEKKAEEHPGGVLVAIDAATGKTRWKNDQDIFGTMLSLSAEHGTLLMSYQPTRFQLASEIGDRMAAFTTSDGARRWEKKAKYETRPLINDYTIYAQGGAWDLLTGEEREFAFRRSYGCGQLSGSRHMLLFRSATLGYYDLSGKRTTENYGGMRPGCWINAIAVGGLVLVPDATAGCQCSYLNQSWMALEPLRSEED